MTPLSAVLCQAINAVVASQVSDSRDGVAGAGLFRPVELSRRPVSRHDIVAALLNTVTSNCIAAFAAAPSHRASQNLLSLP
jgi:hypothetical protein